MLPLVVNSFVKVGNHSYICTWQDSKYDTGHNRGSLKCNFVMKPLQSSRLPLETTTDVRNSDLIAGGKILRGYFL